LRGNPLKITQFIFELIKKNAGIAEMNTEKVTLLEMMKSLEISKDSARTALRFLLKNKLVKRVDFHAGKYGWSKYELKKNLFDELEEAYQKGSIDPLILKGSNNSSNYIYNITTTDRPLLVGWDEIDVTPLENIGLTKKHLVSLKSKNIPEVVQESINHFAFAMQHNPKVKKYDSPLEVFIGVLRKGNSWIESSYKSPQEIALEKMIEEKNRERKKIADLEQELLKIEFDAWYSSLTEGKKEELTRELKLSSIMPEGMQKKTKESYLLSYFEKHIFKKQ
jgi:hypothetical protein